MKRSYEIEVNAKTFSVELIERLDDSVRFVVSGSEYHVRIAPKIAEPVLGRTTIPIAIPVRTQAESPRAVAGGVVAPMPGIVTKIMCAVGDNVEAGAPLVIIEAMKMENSISAQISGIVSQVLVSAGTEVKKGQSLVVLA
jgi:biotin carboxyl carrier protein